jgi:hypothetical protein
MVESFQVNTVDEDTSNNSTFEAKSNNSTFEDYQNKNCPPMSLVLCTPDGGPRCNGSSDTITLLLSQGWKVGGYLG